MFKYLISLVLLVGCGGPQTTMEVEADNMLSEFVVDCKNFYGIRCDVPVVVHSFSESTDEQTCWFEYGNPVRQVVIHKDSVVQSNRAAVYELFFECSLNLGTPEEELFKFEDFSLALGFLRK